MVQDLLRYSRLDSDANPLESTDAGAVVASALDNLQMQIEDSSADITVEDLPTIKADANQLEQVFQNLIPNAIKYRDEMPPESRFGASAMMGWFA